jgi:hypothetical protein
VGAVAVVDGVVVVAGGAACSLQPPGSASHRLRVGAGAAIRERES